MDKLLLIFIYGSSYALVLWSPLKIATELACKQNKIAHRFNQTNNAAIHSHRWFHVDMRRAVEEERDWG